MEELRKVESFEALGEIYRREKDEGGADIATNMGPCGGTLQGELEGGESVTVFADLRAGDLRVFEGAMRNNLRTEKDDAVYVVETQPDGRMKVVEGIPNVMDPDKLQLAMIRKGKVVETRPATLIPREGLNYFAISQRVMGGQNKNVVERRLGGKVTKIDYKK